MEKIKNFPNRRVESWSKYLDGAVWLFRQGDDFDCDLAAFQMRARGAAEYRGLKVSAVKTKDKDERPAVAIQARAGRNGLG